MGAPSRVLVHLFPGNRGEQSPELGRQGVLSLVLVLAPFQVRQGRRGEIVWKMDLPNRRDECDDFDPVSLFEVAFGDRTSSHSTW